MVFHAFSLITMWMNTSFFKGCTDVMHAAKNTWQLVVDLSCFCDVPVVSSCGSETTTFDQKVQWSSFEKRRGDDVMSTSFWFQGVPCVACLLYARILFSSSVSHVALHECGCAFDCDIVCDVCLQCFWRRQTLVVVLPSESQVVQHGCTLR